MKVCLAALIPLQLAFLIVLPSDVSARRRIRQELEGKEDENEIRHIRNRPTTGWENFKGPNLKKACELCHRLYNINKNNCMMIRHKAHTICYKKAGRDQAAFKFLFHKPGPKAGPKAAPKAQAAPASAAEKPERKLKLGSVDAYFKPEHLKKTCKICAEIGGVVYDDCVAKVHDGKKFCEGTIDEMRRTFNEYWAKPQRTERKLRNSRI